METKVLRPSVMVAREWFKERDQEQWKHIKQSVLQRDGYTCVYCHLVARKFMQVNHIGAEDDHRPKNLETVCAACHSVLHLGISALRGTLTVFESRPEAENIAAIVVRTRALVARSLPWPEIEQRILAQFLRPGGVHYTPEESVGWANKMLQEARPPAVRGYLPSGYAVLFHEEGEWNDFPERVWKWQCL